MRLAILFFLLLINSAQAVEVVPITGKHCVLTKNISVSDLASNAGIIFRGKFEDFSITEENGLTVRNLVFRVLDPIRGVDEGQKKLTLKEWAKIRSPFTTQEIAKDQDYVFFFNTPSSKGLTSLVGMEQGLVGVEDDGGLKFSKRLNLGSSYNDKARLTVMNSEMNLAQYEGLKEFCSK